MRVSELDGWIPQPGGPRSNGDRAPAPDDVFVERVIHVADDHVMFTCRFVDHATNEPKPRSVYYNFPMLDVETRQKIVEILNENIGNILLSLGTIELSKE